MNSAAQSGPTLALVEAFAKRLPRDPAPGLPWRANLALYLDCLSTYNRAFNLVGRQRPKDILDDLVSDSFHLAELLTDLGAGEATLALDCGAGAGLPGIPLRMTWQNGEYVLAETRQKRALFMQNVLARLDLPRTRVFHGDAAKFPSAPDIVISRAWREPRAALDFAAKILAPGGFVVLFARALAPQPPFETVLAREYDSPGGKRAILALRHAAS